MQKINNPIIILEDDYKILLSYLSDERYTKKNDAQNAKELGAELKKAILVSKENFPNDVVRLNSKVKIKEGSQNRIIELILVTPDKADISKRKISVMAPVGTALVGFRKGQKIKWRVPAGEKTFTIIEVINQHDIMHIE